MDSWTARTSRDWPITSECVIIPRIPPAVITVNSAPSRRFSIVNTGPWTMAVMSGDFSSVFLFFHDAFLITYMQHLKVWAKAVITLTKVQKRGKTMPTGKGWPKSASGLEDQKCHWLTSSIHDDLNSICWWREVYLDHSFTTDIMIFKSWQFSKIFKYER